MICGHYAGVCSNESERTDDFARRISFMVGLKFEIEIIESLLQNIKDDIKIALPRSCMAAITVTVQ